MVNGLKLKEPDMDISANAAFINVDMTIWTGRAHLPTNTQTIVDGVTIPAEIKSNGNIDIYDPDQLRPFAGIKSRLVRTMKDNTLRFLGGYTLDIDLVADLEAKLNDIKTAFYNQVDILLGNYEQTCADWLDAHADCAALIRDKQPTKTKVKQKFAFDWQLYQINPINISAQEAANNIGNVALEELAGAIGAVYQKTFVESNGPNFTLAINGLVNRCKVLSFTTPYIGQLSTLFQTLIQSRKREVCAAVLRVLSTPESLMSFCDAVKENNLTTAQDLVMFAAPMAAQEEAQVEPEPTPEPQPSVPEVHDMVDNMCAFLDSGGLY